MLSERVCWSLSLTVMLAVATTTRQLAVGLALSGLVGVARPLLAAGEDAARMPRVRSSNPSLVALMAAAVEGSGTFRHLVATIDRSDGIVYVEEGTCGHGVRACLVGVSVAGPHRLLRVAVDMRKADREVMASIGHELQHAVEVLSEPAVRSSTDMFFFYFRSGRDATGAFETEDAIAAGRAVRAEVHRSTPQVRDH